MNGCYHEWTRYKLDHIRTVVDGEYVAKPLNIESDPDDISICYKCRATCYLIGKELFVTYDTPHDEARKYHASNGTTWAIDILENNKNLWKRILK